MTKKLSEEIQEQLESKLRLSHLLGCNYGDGNKINPPLAFVFFMGALAHVMFVNGLMHNGFNIPLICNSMAIYCLVFQMVVRLLNKFIRDDHGRLLALMKMIYRFYEREEQVHRYRTILGDYVKTAKFLMNGYLFMMLGMLCVPIPTALVLSYYTDEFILFIPFVLPFTDPLSLSGYIINSVLNVYYFSLAYVGFTCCDVFYILYAYQSIPMVNIYCLKWQEFGEKLIKVKTEKVEVDEGQMQQKSTSQDGSKIKQQPSTTQDTLKIKEQQEAKKAAEIEKVEHELIDLIKEFNIYNAYIKSTVENMELTHFAAMTLDSMGIAMSIVVLLTWSKVMGFIIMAFLMIEMFIPCVLGTLIVHQKEKLLNELFAFKWYELSLSKQKIFLQFIHLCQNSQEFVIPIVGDINMELFKTAMNGAYSYFMYLLKFVKMN